MVSCKPVLRVCDIKQTGVEEMVKKTSVEVVEGVCYHANPCCGDALSSKLILRRCVITQTGVEEMRYQTTLC